MAVCLRQEREIDRLADPRPLRLEEVEALAEKGEAFVDAAAADPPPAALDRAPAEQPPEAIFPRDPHALLEPRAAGGLVPGDSQVPAGVQECPAEREGALEPPCVVEHLAHPYPALVGKPQAPEGGGGVGEASDAAVHELPLRAGAVLCGVVHRETGIRMGE